MANIPTQTQRLAPHDVSRGLTLAQAGSNSRRSYPRISAIWRSVVSGTRKLFFKKQKKQKKEAGVPGKEADVPGKEADVSGKEADVPGKEADVPGKFMIPSRPLRAS
jgi:hypothetical protein